MAGRSKGLFFVFCLSHLPVAIPAHFQGGSPAAAIAQAEAMAPPPADTNDEYLYSTFEGSKHSEGYDTGAAFKAPEGMYADIPGDSTGNCLVSFSLQA